MITIDVGGDDLDVEVQTSGFQLTPDDSGVSVKRSLAGTLIATRTFAGRSTWTGTLTKALTTDELADLRAAAKWPQTIVVGGEAFRADAANTTPQTVNAKVQITSEDFMPVGGTDFLHIAHVTIFRAD